MSDFDREMARWYCKVLGCIDPDHDLLSYRMAVFLPYDQLVRGWFRDTFDRFVAKFGNRTRVEEFEQLLSVEHPELAMEGDPLWFNRTAIPAYHNYYKALYVAVTGRGVDIGSVFWGDMKECLDKLGGLKPFVGANVPAVSKYRLLTPQQPVFPSPEELLLVHGPEYGCDPDYGYPQLYDPEELSEEAPADEDGSYDYPIQKERLPDGLVLLYPESAKDELVIHVEQEKPDPPDQPLLNAKRDRQMVERMRTEHRDYRVTWIIEP